MRIVQTFWSAKRLPLLSHFGWAEPEYNLMSWTLSCYSLRKHYDEVALYTDTAGKHLLIDMLHLPYTEVNVVFDDFPCLPQHWALSKIKTYSLQTKPFLHVDGDVFLPNPLPKEIEEAPLVAQNREIGTGYYRHMMDNILRYPEIHLADYVMEGLRTESIASYNMGIFGGNDLYFIHRYCQESFNFMEENHMNEEKERQSRVDCNVFFEQMLFAIMADREVRDVASVLGRAMRDEGYTRKEFCDLDHYGQANLYHILGGHKRNERVLAAMERLMLRSFPEIYRQIISYYPERHLRMGQTPSPDVKFLSAQESLAQYEDFLTKQKQVWQNLNVDELLKLDSDAAKYIHFIEDSSEKQQSYILRSHPYIEYFHIPVNWHPWAVRQLKERLKCEIQFPLTLVTAKPVLRGDGVQDVALLDTSVQILEILKEEPLRFKKLQDIISNQLGVGDKERRQSDLLVLHEVSQLLYYGLILINEV